MATAYRYSKKSVQARLDRLARMTGPLPEDGDKWDVDSLDGRYRLLIQSGRWTVKASVGPGMVGGYYSAREFCDCFDFAASLLEVLERAGLIRWVGKAVQHG